MRWCTITTQTNTHTHTTDIPGLFHEKEGVGYSVHVIIEMRMHLQRSPESQFRGLEVNSAWLEVLGELKRLFK